MADAGVRDIGEAVRRSGGGDVFDGGELGGRGGAEAGVQDDGEARVEACGGPRAPSR